eukprot:4275164-Prymnesium_polylepis.1
MWRRGRASSSPAAALPTRTPAKGQHRREPPMSGTMKWGDTPPTPPAEGSGVPRTNSQEDEYTLLEKLGEGCARTHFTATHHACLGASDAIPCAQVVRQGLQGHAARRRG